MTDADCWGAVNPTSCLPRVKGRPEARLLFSALCHLADLYSPQSVTRTDDLLRENEFDGQAWASDEMLQDALDAARADENERRFAMSWLTRLIGSGLDWLDDNESTPAVTSVDALLDLAGRILGGHAALEEAGAIHRSFAFPLSDPVLVPGVLCTPSQTIQNGSICITLRDDALPPSTDIGKKGVEGSEVAAAAVGVQTWGSAVVFSDVFTRHPNLFHKALETSSVTDDSSLDVLELGSGTGLVGMVAAQYFEHIRVTANVMLSDYHDRVLDNLAYNIKQNFSETATCPRVEKLDWCDLHQQCLQGEFVERKRYDLLLLADVIYAPDHALWLRSTISTVLKKPTAEGDRSDARAHIIMAVRPSGKHEGLYHTVEAVFGTHLRTSTLPSLLSSNSVTPYDTVPGTPTHATVPARSKERDDRHSSMLHSSITALQLQHTEAQPHLRILNRRWLDKRAGIGRHDEQGYYWYEIGWTFETTSLA